MVQENLLLFIEEEQRKFIARSRQHVDNFDGSNFMSLGQHYEDNRWKRIGDQWREIITGLRNNCLVSCTSWYIYARYNSLFERIEERYLIHTKGYNDLINDFTSMTSEILDQVKLFPGPYTYDRLSDFENIFMDLFCQFWIARKQLEWRNENPDQNRDVSWADEWLFEQNFSTMSL